jgi:glutathione S-transferase
MPVFQDEHVTLFESGAILHHIAQDCPALMPDDVAGRAQVLSWMFAALNSFEQDVMGVVGLDMAPPDAEWVAQRRPALEAALEKRLSSVETWLSTRDYLAERFTVADILMAWELKLVEAIGALGRYPALASYYRRCTARPAYLKALADHKAVYQG